MTFPATAGNPKKRPKSRPQGRGRAVTWALTCLATGAAGCGGDGPRVIHGTGPVVREQRVYRPAERIEARGYTNLAIEALPLEPGSLPESSGGDTVVFLEGAQDLLAWVETSLSGDTLTISFREGVRLDPLPSIEVQTSYLVSLSSFGSGDIQLRGLTPASTRGESLELEFLGSADFHAEGEVSTVKIDQIGSGDLNLRGLHSRHVRYSSLGSGEAWLHASESVDASLKGSGDLHIHGSVPDERNSSSVLGSGKVFRVRD